LIICSDAGIKNDFNDEQPRNAPSSIRLSFDPDSNVNDESDLHQQKDPPQRTSTDAGIQIVLSDEHEANEFSEIRVSVDPNSNVNEESNVHSKKQRSQRISTDDGIEIDCNDEQRRNESASIRARVGSDSDIPASEPKRQRFTQNRINSRERQPSQTRGDEQ
jgi:hypothetical protein